MFSRMRSLVVAFSLLAATGMPLIAGPVEIIPPELRGAAQPQVAMAPDGRLHVVFGKGLSIYHTASADGARTFSKPVRIADLPKLALGLRRGPRVVATDQLITVTAISHTEGDLAAWTSADHGATWTALQNLNDAAKAAREGLHAMGSDGKGLVAVAWLDLRNAGTEVWSTVSHDGGATWGTNVRVYKSPDGHVCECCQPSVAIDPRGRIAVMFRNWLGGSRDMYLATSSDGGKTFAPAAKLGAGTWKLNGCPMDGGALAFTAPGRLGTVWRRETTVFASDPSGSEQRLADAAFHPIIVTGKFGAAYLWGQSGGLMLKKGTSTPSRLTGNGAFASAASAPNRDPVVVWESTGSSDKTLFAEVLR